jgi:pantoate--beta-alanine ligase
VTSPVVATTLEELADARADLPGPVGLVPTMGALHEGHAALLRFARADCASVVATIFVNPLQFGPGEDFERYPRTLDADLDLCGGEGVDLVFAPSTAVMYPTGDPLVRIDPGPLGQRLEGESRPGHFAGMLTVVAKLLTLTRPDRAYFGEKDYQQLVLITRMVADLNLGVGITGVPIVRDDDGLARSSRNRYLSDDERRAATVIPRAIAAGRTAAHRDGGADDVRRAVLALLETEPLVRLDRLDLVDASDLRPLTRHAPGRLLIAAFVGSTRLIDNCDLRIGKD